MSAASTFDMLRAALAADPSLGAKLKGKLCFVLGSDNTWLVDAAAGEVAKVDSAPKADCTVNMTEADFVALAAGKLSGMSAYMTGKMKLSGKVALAQKFGDLAAAARKQKPKAAAAAPPLAATSSTPPAMSVPPPDGFASNAVFAKIAANLQANGPALLKKVNGSFVFKLSGGPSGACATWTVDARAASAPVGTVTPVEGVVPKPDCTIAISDADLVALSSGKLSAMSAYMSGKLKLTGKSSLAQKLAVLLSDGKPKAKL